MTEVTGDRGGEHNGNHRLTREQVPEPARKCFHCCRKQHAKCGGSTYVFGALRVCRCDCQMLKVADEVGMTAISRKERWGD